MNNSGNRIVPIDPDALLWGLPAAAVGIVGFIWGWTWLWAICLILITAICCFFRDPPRNGESAEGAIWSPADGVIDLIEPNEDPDVGPVPGHKIAIFLSVLDCHINRAPCDAIVEGLRYKPGEFLNAMNPESGLRNECNWIFMKSGRHRVTVRQISGLIARRIVCRVKAGDSLERGGRIGLIRFGSRTELYLPAEAEVKVSKGDRVYGSRTTVAILPE